jgi:hypothetical protein
LPEKRDENSCTYKRFDKIEQTSGEAGAPPTTEKQFLEQRCGSELEVSLCKCGFGISERDLLKYGKDREDVSFSHQVWASHFLELFDF